jgi:hypothetical protein
MSKYSTHPDHDPVRKPDLVARQPSPIRATLLPNARSRSRPAPLENHNADAKPFIWTKSAGQILEKVARAKQALESQH